MNGATNWRRCAAFGLTIILNATDVTTSVAHADSPTKPPRHAVRLPKAPREKPSRKKEGLRDPFKPDPADGKPRRHSANLPKAPHAKPEKEEGLRAPFESEPGDGKPLKDPWTNSPPQDNHVKDPWGK